MNIQHSHKCNSPIPFEPIFHIPTCIHRHTAMHISQAHGLTQILTLWSKQMFILKYERKRINQLCRYVRPLATGFRHQSQFLM